MLHPLQEMIVRRNKGEKCGIPSYCSANELVIEAALDRARMTDTPVLIEATANQVNQFRGYTGMLPSDFRDFVYQIAERTGTDRKLILLGGDHLGPLTWVDEDERNAMEKSAELVYQYVAAGFTKIHLDTSMKVASDNKDELLATRTIADRGVRLYKTAIEAYEELIEKEPDALRPVFIIGSEVPIPGGAQEEEDSIAVTRPEDFEDTVATYTSVFEENGYMNAWEDIIGVVVQPGVEFGDAQVHMYKREEAKTLVDKLKQYPQIVFEGHSTDYQTPVALREMVEDGIAILKVGPALTYGLREALFALSMIEKELLPPEKCSYFEEVLERMMLEKPDNWKKHYHGDDKRMHLARKYSFSDRSRYYLGEEEVQIAINKLFANLSMIEIPMNILCQYMPIQYKKVREELLRLEPRELAKDGVVNIMEDYEFATRDL